jgi:hypothetical protein
MMHSNNFVLAVKDSNKKVLREIAGKVYLPFNSEYSLLLKNDNWQRACCSVSIDGTDVLGGDELILHSYSSVDLERFLVDGDMLRGNRFKFVPLCHSEVQDPNSPENGLIEVKFWKEIQKTVYFNYIVPDSGFYPKPYVPCNDGGSICSRGGQSINSFYSCSNSTGNAKCSTNSMMGAQNVTFTAGTPGATVPGSMSGQVFGRTSFEGKDGSPTIIRLQLMGRQEPITVEKTRHVYCGQCGKSNPYGNKFCGRCGTQLSKFVEV